MSRASLDHRPIFSGRFALLGLVGFTVAAWVMGFLADSQGAMRALLVAWILWMGVATGSAVWLAIHGITSGRWGDNARRILVCLAAGVPWLAPLFAIIILGAGYLYPWASDTSAAAWPGVSTLYLNVPAFAVRGIAILASWSWIARVVSADAPASPRLSGFCLALYGLSVSIAAVDWTMSLAPRWTSTAFAALFALTQLTSALAVVALIRAPGDPRETSTLAQLLLACILGVTYLGFMQFLVIWSGNLPDKVVWFVDRSSWEPIILAAFSVGGLLPFVALLRARDRTNAARLRWMGAATLSGVALLDIWQIGPGSGAATWLLPILPLTFGAAWLMLLQPSERHALFGRGTYGS